MTNVAIIGTVGVPAEYGGFETLAENLANYHCESNVKCSLTIYCSARAYKKKIPFFKKSKLTYLPLKANGPQAIFYDIFSAIHAAASGCNTIVFLGHGGSFVIPLIRLISNVRIITNIDGIEWRRRKWSIFTRYLMKATEYIAIKYSHVVIADNQEICDYVLERHGVRAKLIEYGGDCQLAHDKDSEIFNLPPSYALALCRIEPENNAELILDAFVDAPFNLVFVGNWNYSAYSRDLHKRFSKYDNIKLIGPVYDKSHLHSIRRKADCYVHGHSAGGTNPALVEMMHYAKVIYTFDCAYNRYTTENKAAYFQSSHDLRVLIEGLQAEAPAHNAQVMLEIATRRYTWPKIAQRYFELFEGLYSQ